MHTLLRGQTSAARARGAARVRPCCTTDGSQQQLQLQQIPQAFTSKCLCSTARPGWRQPYLGLRWLQTDMQRGDEQALARQLQQQRLCCPSACAAPVCHWLLLLLRSALLPPAGTMMSCVNPVCKHPADVQIRLFSPALCTLDRHRQEEAPPLRAVTDAATPTSSAWNASSELSRALRAPPCRGPGSAAASGCCCRFFRAPSTSRMARSSGCRRDAESGRSI